MTIRTANMGDLDEILKIYSDARIYMKEHGNPTQWGDSYPEQDLLIEDIRLQRLFVCTDDEKILGVFCYFEGEEPSYRKIEGGHWLNDDPYGVIHRIAVTSHRRGVASFCYRSCFEHCKNLRIDTHRNNLPMQNSLKRSGFSYCGIIHLKNGDERLAYQKVPAPSDESEN